MSDNLINWRGEPALSETVRNTNTTSVYSFEIYETPKFVRAYLFMNREICTAQLKAIELAIRTWAIEARRSLTSTVAESDITPYLNASNPHFVCPSGGTTFSDSYTITTAAQQPVCKKVPASHVLPP